MWIDAHLDLAYLALRGRDLRVPCPDPLTACVSLPAMREAGIELAFATIFTEPDEPDGAEAAGLRQVEVYKALESEGEISIVRRGADLEAPRGARGPKIVLLMEGADPIRDPSDVERWHADGLRMVGLTWAMGTRYAGGNGNPGPLTPLGAELVAALDEVGMIHDASHLADEALDGLLSTAAADAPIVATHSNCRELVADDQRHLRDDQIKTLGDRGAVIGLNLYTEFLVRGRRATIADCVAHVQRVTGIMGHRSGVGLGSDMDGGFGPGDVPVGLEHPRNLESLADALRTAGWSDQELVGFRYANWRRFLARSLPQS